MYILKLMIKDVLILLRWVFTAGVFVSFGGAPLVLAIEFDTVYLLLIYLGYALGYALIVWTISLVARNRAEKK